LQIIKFYSIVLCCHQWVANLYNLYFYPRLWLESGATRCFASQPQSQRRYGGTMAKAKCKNHSGGRTTRVVREGDFIVTYASCETCETEYEAGTRYNPKKKDK
jgi:hypothetical protein